LEAEELSNQRRARRHSNFLVDVFQVVLNGLLGDEAAVGNLPVSESLQNQMNDLLLPAA
jgi:hypothetical protein